MPTWISTSSLPFLCFLWLSSVPPGKCQESTFIRPWPVPNPLQFMIEHYTVSHWQHCKITFYLYKCIITHHIVITLVCLSRKIRTVIWESTFKECTRETCGSAYQTAEMEVDWTYTEEWFLCHSVDKDNIEQEDWGGRGVW